jgi:hypothetical protein
MYRQKPQPTSHQQPRLWLAAANGVRLDSQEEITPLNAPEAVIEVEFVGLTEAEQRAALEAFPGGRRFRLKESDEGRTARPTRH